MRPSRPLVVLLSAVLVVAAAGCGGGGEKAPGAAELVQRAAQTTGAEKRFHFVFDEQHGPKSTKGVHLVFAEGDIAVPDKVKADVSGTFAGLPIHTQLVVAGGTTWLKNPITGSWQKVSVGTSPVSFFDPAKGVLAVIRTASQLSVEGGEKIGDTDTWHLSGKTPVGSIRPLLGNPGGTRLVDVDLWVDKRTGRLVRLRLSGQVETGDPTSAERTIDISRYGVVVPIAPPSGG